MSKIQMVDNMIPRSMDTAYTDWVPHGSISMLGWAKKDGFMCHISIKYIKCICRDFDPSSRLL